MKNKKIQYGLGLSKLELLTKFRDIHRSNPSGVTFQIVTQGHCAVPNRINRYVRDSKSVSMNSKGIRLAGSGSNFGEIISFAETLGISYTLPNNTHHRLC